MEINIGLDCARRTERQALLRRKENWTTFATFAKLETERDHCWFVRRKPRLPGIFHYIVSCLVHTRGFTRRE